jgi:AP-2 complex subunit sigma-1
MHAQFKNFKLIYRRYAGLFFVFGVDIVDNELLLMETIHLFVELLDQFFGNVCELDIVYNFNKVRRGGEGASTFRACLTFLQQVYAILDEYVLAGEVQETSKRQILERVKELEKLE